MDSAQRIIAAALAVAATVSKKALEREDGYLSSVDRQALRLLVAELEAAMPGALDRVREQARR